MNKPPKQDDNDSPPRETQPKQRVLHTRVPERLEQELKRRASELGVSVSNLVRNVLHNTFDMVEEVVSDTSQIARSMGGPRRKANREEPVPVLGWQELVLDVNALCDECNEILPKGTKVAIAVPTSPDSPTFRCIKCMPTASAHKE